MFAVSLTSAAQPQPSPASSGVELDSKTKQEIVEMEKQLGRAMERRDTPALEKILADHYFDAFSDENALSRANTIAVARLACSVFWPSRRSYRSAQIGKALPSKAWPDIIRLESMIARLTKNGLASGVFGQRKMDDGCS